MARTPSFIRGREDQPASDQWLQANIAVCTDASEIARHLKVMHAAFWGPGSDSPYVCFREACNHYLNTDREGRWPQPVRDAYEQLRESYGKAWNYETRVYVLGGEVYGVDRVTTPGFTCGEWEQNPDRPQP